MRRLATLVLLTVGLASCSPAGGESATGPDPNVIEGCDGVADLLKLREELTPTAGRRVTLRPIGPHGEAVAADPGECLRTSSPGVEIATSPAAVDDPMIAMFVDPGVDDRQAKASATAAVEVLDSLATDVDTAVFGPGPVDDAYSSPAVVADEGAAWMFWTGEGLPPADWSTNPLLLDERQVTATTPVLAVPTGSADRPGRLFGRTALAVDEAPDASGLLFEGSHSGGLVLRLDGDEVVRSNLPDGDLDAATRPLEERREPTDYAVTVPADRIAGRDHVVSIEWFGAADPATPVFTFRAIDRRTRPVEVAPVAGFGDDRRFAVAAVEAREPRRLAATELAPSLAMVASALDERREDASDGPKFVVVVAPHREPEALPAFSGDPVVVWVGDRGGTPPAGVHRAIAADDPGDEGVGAGIASLVESHRRVGVWSVGVCGPAEPIEPVFEVPDTPAKTSPKLDAAVGTRGCDPAAAAGGTPPLTSLRLDLSDDQARVFAQRDADADRRPFAATMRLPGEIEVPAELRVRGQSSLDCERKSYSVSMADRVPLPFFAGWSPSRFTLLSMCLDEGYVRTLTTFRLLEALGLSDLRMDLVELDLGDRELGAYLLIEHPDDLVEHDPTAAGIVRRRLDRSIQASEAQWVRNDRPDVLLSEYDSVIAFAETSTGDDLAAGLDQRMDLDGYLTWLALMSLLENGDYSDEVFFVGVPAARGGEVELRWHLQPWDPDDMFQPCHLDGVLAIADPAGLTSCAESRIDAAILDDPVVAARYQTRLATVLRAVTPAQFDETLSAVRTELDAVLPSDPARTMPELAASDPSVVDASTFGEALDRNEAELLERFGRRHRDLGRRLREHGGGLVDAGTVEQLRLLAPDHTSAGGPVPLVVEARGDDGRIDESVSGLVELHAADGEVSTPFLVLRRGRGSVTTALTARDGESVSISLGAAGPGRQVVVGARDRVVRTMSGDLEGDELVWGPDETIRLPADTRVGTNTDLFIEAGTRVELGSEVNLDVAGGIESRGTVAKPVVFAPVDADEPWGGVLHFTSRGTYEHTWLVGGGADERRAFGHSDSQPVLFASGGSEVTLDHVVIQDGPGKGPSADASTITVTDSLITRVDTGGELVDSDGSIERSWYLDFFGSAGGPDDDNDALYVARSPAGPTRIGPAEPAVTVTSSVFVGGSDDGIDHNGADLDLVDLWVEGFGHECLALSAGGRADISDSVMTGCQHGIEAGYGSPEVDVDHSVMVANEVGLRFGDDYEVTSTGSLTVRNSIVVDNGDDVAGAGSAPGSIELVRTLVGAPDGDDEAVTGGKVLVGTVIFTDRYLLGPLSAGRGEGADGRDLGLLSARPR